MATDSIKVTGPDLARGIAFAELPDGGMITGQAGGEPVLLVRQGEEIFAIGAVCTHYSGPLAEGLIVGETIRCPWHHACFSLRSGQALRAPALNPVSSYDVDKRGDSVFVRRRRDHVTSVRRHVPRTEAPRSVGIVGAGAAGNSAAEELRHLGFEGEITLIDR